jgi:Transposase DDE domain group 1
MLALRDTPARRWEPRRPRFRLFATAGRIVRGGRRARLRLAAASPWSLLITTALSRLGDLAPG